jgi:hypothetical protein
VFVVLLEFPKGHISPRKRQQQKKEKIGKKENTIRV